MNTPVIFLSLDELWKILFDGSKGLLLGERIGIVVLIALISLAAMFLKDRLKGIDIDKFSEKNPSLLKLMQFVVFIAGSGYRQNLKNSTKQRTKML